MQTCLNRSIGGILALTVAAVALNAERAMADPVTIRGFLDGQPAGALIQTIQKPQPLLHVRQRQRARAIRQGLDRLGLEDVSSAADGVAQRRGDHEDQADHENDDPDRRKQGDVGDDADHEQYQAQHDHAESNLRGELGGVGRPGGNPRCRRFVRPYTSARTARRRRMSRLR